MVLPVANWATEFGEVKLYHDLQDPKLMHYGPNETWSALTKQSLGGQFTVVRGEVDCGFTSAQLDGLQAAFPGLRLTPLVAQDVGNRVVPTIPITTPHVLKLSLIMSLPFPKLSFNLTVSHQDAQYAALVTRIEQAWAAKGLFSGGIEFAYAMRVASCAYSVTLPRTEVSNALSGGLAGAKWPLVQLGGEVAKIVAANRANWIRPTAPPGFPNDCDAEVLAVVVDYVLKLFFRPTAPILTFDNGDSLEAVEMVPALTLAPTHDSTLTKSADSIATIRVL